MTDAIPAEVRQRVADLVELQPTKNAELQDRWDMADGSAVHRYLEDELKDYYYRDADSRIMATATAVELVGGESKPTAVTPLQQELLEVLAGPDERSQSVVAALHALRNAGTETDVDAVRSALRSLADKGLVTVEQRTVPTFRLAVARADLDVAVREDATPEHRDDEGVMADIEAELDSV